jgi:hypothetical protein
MENFVVLNIDKTKESLHSMKSVQTSNSLQEKNRIEQEGEV